MRYIILLFLSLSVIGIKAQSIVGTWQLIEEKSCMETNMEMSETEKELLPAFGSSSHAVAKIIRFDPKGKGEEGIFSAGKKKGADKEPFRYQLSGDELQFLDKKSGIIKERFVIDVLTSVKLQFHRVGKECEIRTLSRVE